MKKPTRLNFPELYDTLKPIDKLALILFADDAAKGVMSVVKTGYGNNSLTALSYAGLVQAKQGVGEFPVVTYITSRGTAFVVYLKGRTSIEELATQLPERILRKMKG